MARIKAIILSGCILAATQCVWGQTSPERPRPYNGLDASREAQAMFAEQRTYRLGAQIQRNEDMIFWAQPYWYPIGWFEPWPFVAGDIYGYPLSEPPINQSIGVRQRRWGNKTWTSTPIYPDAERSIAGPREF